MSLVIAFIGTQGAVMAGDMREISFGGDPAAIEALERKLYDGTITLDGDLFHCARELGVTLRIRDDKIKVTSRGGILVGEVGERDGAAVRTRRVYASAGNYAIVDVEQEMMTRTATGGAGNFVVLGNEITKKIAHDCISSEWTQGSVEDAIRVIIRILLTAARASPSVSGNYVVVQTRSPANLSSLIEEDRKGVEEPHS